MSANKTKSISESPLVNVGINDKNRQMLADLEYVLMKERDVRDCCYISNADIFNYAVSIAHKVKCRGKK
jgi:hypothetical protein